MTSKLKSAHDNLLKANFLKYQYGMGNYAVYTFIGNSKIKLEIVESTLGLSYDFYECISGAPIDLANLFKKLSRKNRINILFNLDVII